jgi:hypothetical protein
VEINSTQIQKKFMAVPVYGDETWTMTKEDQNQTQTNNQHKILEICCRLFSTEDHEELRIWKNVVKQNRNKNVLD